jgi:hypothetical protein
MMLKSQSHKVTKSQDKLKIKNLLFIFLTCILCLVSWDLFAQSVSSTELINNAKSYDGKTVVYEGEVIGDIMRRGDYAWVNVNDGKNAIGIWIKFSLAGEIGYTGSYKSIGDGVEITGIFHRVCPEHGGDLDIHAQAIRKTGQGRQVQERLNPSKRNQVIVLLGLLCLIWILTLLKRK